MEIIPLCIEKEITSSDDISDLIIQTQQVHDGDILVIAQKIISKQEGRLVDLSTVVPSLLAQGIGSQYQKDPKIIELILSESKRIVRMYNGVLIVETKHGFVCANAGIDESNIAHGYAALLPVNSDLSAKRIQTNIFKKTGKSVAVVISDTFGRPFRNGQTNHAIGISGLDPVLDYTGHLDSFKRVLRVTAIAVADELSSAAELVMGKSLKCPVAVIRGYRFQFQDDADDILDHKPRHASINDLIRAEPEDLFR